MSRWHLPKGRCCLSAVELEYLAALWPTSMPDQSLETIFGMGRGAIRRIAQDQLKLPSRTFARAEASKRYEAIIVAELLRWRQAA